MEHLAQLLREATDAWGRLLDGLDASGDVTRTAVLGAGCLSAATRRDLRFDLEDWSETVDLILRMTA